MLRTLSLSVSRSHNGATKTDFSSKTTGFEVESFDLVNDKNKLQQVLKNYLHSVISFKNGRATSSNFEGFLAIPVDFDDGKMTIEQFKNLYSDYSYVLYTSTNHLEVKSGHESKGEVERFHALLPLPETLNLNNDQASALKTLVMREFADGNPDQKIYNKAAKLYPAKPKNPDKFHMEVNIGKAFNFDLDTIEHEVQVKKNDVKKQVLTSTKKYTASLKVTLSDGKK